jgi:hypothetical protein
MDRHTTCTLACVSVGRIAGICFYAFCLMCGGTWIPVAFGIMEIHIGAAGIRSGWQVPVAASRRNRKRVAIDVAAAYAAHAADAAAH